MHDGQPSGGHHHENGSTHPEEEKNPDTGEQPLSGTVQNGVRVIMMKARRYEFDPSEITVKQGETVRLEITSEDVTHGIDIEGFDIDRKLPPGKEVTVEFTPEKAGPHHFHCSVYCGPGHDRMHGSLHVRPSETN